MTLSITNTPPHWFESPRYRPRRRPDRGGGWFVLDPSCPRAHAVPHDPPHEPDAGRDALRGAFDRTYETWSLPRTAATDSALELVARPGSAVIVAGQQPGFAGGPLLSLYKALTAIAASRVYSTTTGRACVPVFWVAGDDHDLDEVRTTRFPGGADGEAVFSFPTPSDRRPIADYPMTADALGELGRVKDALRERRCGDDASALVDLYATRGLAGGFGAVLSSLLGDAGLLVIDPVQLRALAAPVVGRVLREPDATLNAVVAGARSAEELGLVPIVSSRFPLFVVEDGARHHLSPSGDGFRIDGLDVEGQRTGRELLERLASEPEAFSAGALLRPLVQQATLPCVLTVGGPAEIGYFTQLPPLAEHLGIDTPRIALRLGATLLDGAAARTSRAIDLEVLSRAEAPEDLLTADASIPERAEIVRLAGEIGEALDRAVATLPEALPEARRLRAKSASLPAEIRTFGEKYARAWAKGRESELARAEKLWRTTFPGGVLQERRWNFLHFVAKHGREWIEELLDRLVESPLAVRHWFVRFEADEPGAER